MNLKEKILNFFKKKEKFMENENNRKDDEIPLPNPKPDPYLIHILNHYNGKYLTE